MGLADKIRELQNRPYQERVKILRNSVIVVTIVLLGVWFLTLRLRQMPKTDFSKFSPVIENIKNLKK